VIWFLFVVLLKLQQVISIPGGKSALTTQGVPASNPASIATPPASTDGGTSIDPTG
jgi:hypothetical protein